MNRRLYRSRSDSVLGGVAGGVAEYLDIDPSIVRVVWAVLAIVTGGLFLLLYIVMWIVVPEGPRWAAPPAAAASMPATPPNAPTGDEAGEPTADASPPPGAGTPTAQPWGSGWPEEVRRHGASGGAWIFGLVLIGLGIWFLLDEYLPAFDRRFVWPVALVVIGVIVLLVSLRRRSE